MPSPAVFLDRDGTIIQDTDYVSDPDEVRLLPGAADAIRRFAEAGYLVVVISNQSGVARGLFDEATLSAVHQRVEDLLREQGATLDGAYYCPYLDGPEATVEAYRRDSELRKPNAGMLMQASEELDVDLSRSWMIGDAAKDVEAGRRAGCRTIRLAVETDEHAHHTARHLLSAADIILKRKRPPRAAESGESRSGGRTEVGMTHGDWDDKVVRSLERIHEELERANRPALQHDFSILRLFCALLQMFAIVMAVLGVIVLADDNQPAATARFTFACFLQLGALTAFAFDRLK